MQPGETEEESENGEGIASRKDAQSIVAVVKRER